MLKFEKMRMYGVTCWVSGAYKIIIYRRLMKNVMHYVPYYFGSSSSNWSTRLTSRGCLPSNEGLGLEEAMQICWRHEKDNPPPTIKHKRKVERVIYNCLSRNRQEDAKNDKPRTTKS